MDSSLLLSIAPNVDVFCPPPKRSRVMAPFIIKGEKGSEKQKRQLCSIDVLPDECLFEILRRLPGTKERSNSACVSKRWLMLLSSIRASEMPYQKKNGTSIRESSKKSLPGLNGAMSANEKEEFESTGYLTRNLKAMEATDVRLATPTPIPFRWPPTPTPDFQGRLSTPQVAPTRIIPTSSPVISGSTRVLFRPSLRLPCSPLRPASQLPFFQCQSQHQSCP